MGRPASNGAPSFRFNHAEVSEMEAILQAHNCAVPAREILEALAQKFSASAERSGVVEVTVKQVWNWFQNRRYAVRAKASKTTVPAQMNMPQEDHTAARIAPQTPQTQPAPSAPVKSMPQVPHPITAPSGQSAGKTASDNSQLEFEAKSARDGAWFLLVNDNDFLSHVFLLRYDVATFLSHRSLETGDPEVLVRFSGFGPEEDEWVNVLKNVRQRSLPCESSECAAVLQGDLILCFQEGKEQALYFDARVLDAQRRRHDVRGCRCRFLVRYEHDQSEEIVPLRKICRRPETDYRLQQLHSGSATVNAQKTGSDPRPGNSSVVNASSATTQKLPTPVPTGESEAPTLPKIA
ncbi:protein SAWADEE HOMEODOMAIN HOMOLOG 2 isoform X1 [Olea europaea var. sylvestris]|uniref:protein SAWADEE HOMEODOMAIN HOMOLOG 2 isoform X1 n=1 Tax=Olea europaea var. sylvestris TaxID=158386 RepID=UPI000C1D2E72|nr:protein SAWADEE HOMEODOMAIN HOMOLOG 2 isoform X1 [Olea europaea var. sylvestris]